MTQTTLSPWHWKEYIDRLWEIMDWKQKCQKKQ